MAALESSSGSSNASSFDEVDDQDWGDWVDDAEDQDGELRIASGSWQDGEKTFYHALFLDGDDVAPRLKQFNTALEALNHAESRGCRLLEVIRRCRLDPLQIIRLINHLRRQVVDPKSISSHLDPEAVNTLKGNEAFLNDDKELVPVSGYEQDGLLQVDFDELAGEVDEGQQVYASESRRIAELQSQLQATQLAFKDLRKKYMDQSGLGQPPREGDGEMQSVKEKGKGKENGQVVDDDSHYFTSYASHDIHMTMISDKVRTLSYGKFLLSPHNAHLMRGRTVMDVGCGSGILSLFAARAGAKEVIAIDASDVANRAKENIRVNGMEGIITVYKGKMEELEEQLAQYKGKVDVIVSEWMVRVTTSR
jgi:protein arginine N-methyltransferase 3